MIVSIFVRAGDSWCFGLERAVGLVCTFRRTFFEVGEVFEFGLVGDVELVEDDGYFPWVGALCFWLDERFVVMRGVMIVTHASVAV